MYGWNHHGWMLHMDLYLIECCPKELLGEMEVGGGGGDIWFFFWRANNVDDCGKSLLLRCSPAGWERLTAPLVSTTDTSEGPSSAACSNQSHFAGGLEAITATKARGNLKTWSLGRVPRTRLGILTEAAGGGCSSLLHYLTGCAEAKPEGVSERGSTRRTRCGHVYCPHTDNSLFCKHSSRARAAWGHMSSLTLFFKPCEKVFD